jgi:tetratricopeptide (TPR) repeat protein
MLRRVLAAWCLMAVSLPLACVARTSARDTNSAATISVRDLSIPDKARRNFNEGTRLLASRDWPGSVLKFQQAVDAFPGFYEAYYRMGLAKAALKRGAETETAFRKSIELSDGQYAPPYFGMALLLCDETPECAGAEEVARQGLELNSHDDAGHYALSWILYVTNRLPDAQQSIRDTLALDPDLAAAHQLLQKIQQRQSAQSASIQRSNPAFR